jgi:general secretion pathway protein G
MMRTPRKNDAGFTLVELMIVMAIIGVLAVVAIPSYVGAIRQAREAVLKEDLHVMRSAIDSYTADKQKAPQSLQDLVTDGYLRSIPVDPMTRTAETWQTETSDALSSVDQSDPGINDVHSGSQESGSDGQSYSTW